MKEDFYRVIKDLKHYVYIIIFKNFHEKLVTDIKNYQTFIENFCEFYIEI